MNPEETFAGILDGLAKSDSRRGFRFIQKTRPYGAASKFLAYATIERLTADRAGALQSAGLHKGDRVAIVLAENEEFAITFLAALRVGLIPVPICPASGLSQWERYIKNIRHFVQKSGAAAVVSTEKFKPLLVPLYSQCTSLRTVLTVEDLAATSTPMEPVRVTSEDVAFIQFTSGSTARPKGVAITHRNLLANAIGINIHGFKTTPQDVGVSWLPLFHDMGLIGFLLAPLLYQIPVVLIPPMLFIQRPATWLEAISRHRGTISCAPNFAFRLAAKRVSSGEESSLDLSSWRIAGCGAEPIRPNDLLGFAQRFAAQGFKASALLPMYGLAESTLAVSLSTPGAGLQTLTLDYRKMSEERWAVPSANAGQDESEVAACGFALPDHRIAVFDIDDQASLLPLPDCSVGEIRVAGPSVMKCYWDDPEETSAAFAGEYLRTGDLGFMQNGQVHVCGRLKEMIIINGRNYFPQDIEDILELVPGIQEGSVAAFGVHGVFASDEHEKVIVAVRISEPDKFDPELAVQAVQAALGIAVDIVELANGQLAKTSSGKLQRMKMRELYETGQLRSFRQRKEEPVLFSARPGAQNFLSKESR
jgi:fatty-acyl-CoA synthase